MLVSAFDTAQRDAIARARAARSRALTRILRAALGRRR